MALSILPEMVKSVTSQQLVALVLHILVIVVYSLVGNTIRVCNSDGRWSGTDPGCTQSIKKLIQCVKLIIILVLNLII